MQAGDAACRPTHGHAGRPSSTDLRAHGPARADTRATRMRGRTAQNTRAGRGYKLNIVNLYKSDSLYNYGLRPLLHSAHRARHGDGVGWHRAGEDICYYPNGRVKAAAGAHPAPGAAATPPAAGAAGAGGGSKAGGKGKAKGGKGREKAMYTLSFRLTTAYDQDR